LFLQGYFYNLLRSRPFATRNSISLRASTHNCLNLLTRNHNRATGRHFVRQE